MVPAGYAEEFREIYDVSVHAEDRVGDDESGARSARPDLPLQITHVVVTVDDDLRAAEAAAVDDAGMIEFIAENDIGTGAERGNHAGIRGEARSEGNRILRAFELGKSVFEFLVNRLRAGREAGAACACAIFPDGFDSGILHARIVCKVQIVVGSEH